MTAFLGLQLHPAVILNNLWAVMLKPLSKLK